MVAHIQVHNIRAGGNFSRHIGLTELVVAPSDHAAILQPGRKVVASAANLDDLRAQLRHLVLALHARAPDIDLALVRHCCHGGRRCGDIHDLLALQALGNLGEGAALVLVASVGHRAVLLQDDILVGRQGNLGNVALILGADLDIRHVAVAPQVQVAVIRHHSRELVGGLQLDDIPALLHGLGHLGGELVLLQAGVAPYIQLAVLVQSHGVVGAAGQLHQRGILHCLRNVGQINLVGNAGHAPGVDVAVRVKADAVGIAGRDIRHLALHGTGNLHHGKSRRQVGQGGILFAQIQHQKARTDQHQRENQQKGNQCETNRTLIEELLGHGLERCLHLLFRQQIHDLLLTQERTLEPANEEKFLLLWRCHHSSSLLTYPRGRAGQPDRS